MLQNGDTVVLEIPVQNLSKPISLAAMLERVSADNFPICIGEQVFQRMMPNKSTSACKENTFHEGCLP